MTSVTIKDLPNLPKKKVTKIKLKWGRKVIPGYILDKPNFRTIVLTDNKNGKVVNPKTGQTNYYAASDRPSNSCLGMTINGSKSVARQSAVRVLSKDGCEVSVTGTEMMKLVHAINRAFGVTRSWLNDHSHVNVDGHAVRLALISLIKYGKTWYERQGYQLVSSGDKLRKKFLCLTTDKVVKFLKKSLQSQAKKKLKEDIRNLIPEFEKKGVKSKLFHQTLRKMLKADPKSILWFDFIFYLLKPLQKGVGKQLFDLMNGIVRHTKQLS